MQVEHRPQESCFLYQTGQAEARLDYRLLQINGHSAVDFYHTFVPPELRGRGIAALLTEAALTWARQLQLCGTGVIKLAIFGKCIQIYIVYANSEGAAADDPTASSIQ